MLWPQARAHAHPPLADYWAMQLTVLLAAYFGLLDTTTHVQRLGSSHFGNCICRAVDSTAGKGCSIWVDIGLEFDRCVCKAQACTKHHGGICNWHCAAEHCVSDSHCAEAAPEEIQLYVWWAR